MLSFLREEPKRRGPDEWTPVEGLTTILVVCFLAIVWGLAMAGMILTAGRW